ncbi:hypothetical protein BOX15_Mlig028111g1, partial [Macrostomum lignano]
DAPNSKDFLAVSREFFKSHEEIPDSTTHKSGSHSNTSSGSGGYQSDPSSPSSLTSRESRGGVGSSGSSGCGDLRDRVSSNGGTIILGSRVFLCPTETAVDGDSAMTYEEASEQLQLPMLDLSQDELGGLKQWAEQVALWRMACDSVLKEMDTRLNQLEESKVKSESAQVSLKAQFHHERSSVQQMVAQREKVTMVFSATKLLADQTQQQLDGMAGDLHVKNTAEHAELQALMRLTEDTGAKFFNAALFDRIKKCEERLRALEPVVAAARQEHLSNRPVAARLKQLKSQVATRRADLSRARQLLDSLTAASATQRSKVNQMGAAGRLNRVVAKPSSTGRSHCWQEQHREDRQQQRHQLRRRRLQRRKERKCRILKLKQDERMLNEKLQRLRIQRLRILSGRTAQRSAQAASAAAKSARIAKKRRRLLALHRRMSSAVDGANRRFKVDRLRARVKRAEAAALSVARARRQLAKRRQLLAEARRVGVILDRLQRRTAGRRQLRRLFADLRERLEGALRRLQLRPLRQVSQKCSKNVPSRRVKSRAKNNNKY